jgi:membrane protein DedA with SNARE-associated domain
MSLTQLLADYGYLAVFVGSLLEGETILVMAGFAAHQGHLSMLLVLGIAFVGGTLGDQLFFWAGRAWGASLLRRIPGAAPRAVRVGELLRRHDAVLIVSIRFMYGLRIVGPIAMGASGIRPGRFLRYNLLGAAIWAPLVGGAGYLFGHMLQMILGDISHYEELALVVIVVLLVVAALLRRRRSGDDTSSHSPR